MSTKWFKILTAYKIWKEPSDIFGGLFLFFGGCHRNKAKLRAPG